MTPTEKALRRRIAALRQELRMQVEYATTDGQRHNARAALAADDRRARRMREGR